MLDDDQLQQLYAWVDEIPLSRPKRNIARDFADGVLAAEVVAHALPKLVDLHNYPAANSMRQKLYNWDTLNVRVLRKINAAITRAEIEGICQCQPGAIEKFLHGLRLKLDRHKRDPPPPPPAHAKSTPPDRQPRTSYTRGREALQQEVDQELLIEKEQEIHELRETIDILEQKVAKLEQLVRLKDAKIQKLREAAGRP
ncbi:hypothetical protein CTAYLR_010442 [Chrysophaeum taylorii]|uniref:Calponin-homology (CH) domain-containing protein n=1 Tax=Chrysophaeum taylorii TaxID=2483200 RepID=A0AAD7U5V7_9STRA|nr:hypothetical protein CTAYLR_010442 [Chrysophaeum taylorii]